MSSEICERPFYFEICHVFTRIKSILGSLLFILEFLPEKSDIRTFNLQLQSFVFGDGDILCFYTRLFILSLVLKNRTEKTFPISTKGLFRYDVMMGGGGMIFADT